MNPIQSIPFVKRFLVVGLLFCWALVASADSVVTFQVDMTAAVGNATFNPATQTMAARGSFNGWNAFPLTNNPSGPNTNLWTGTTNVPGNGTVMQYKYTIEPGANYEAIFAAGSHNRLITLPSVNGASITLPKVFYADTPVTPVTVDVRFQVNLAQQINTGAFDTNSSLPYARGIHNGWSADIALTNDASIRTTNQFGLVNSNVYVNTYQISGSPGQTMDYKFFIDTGANWESPALGTGDPTDNNNRFFNLSDAASQSLPIVYFSDAPFAPVATNDITFQVDMTAQVLNGNFDPTTGTVEVRGGFNSWGTPQILMTNNPAGPNTNLYKTVVRRIDGVGAVAKYKFWSSISVNGGWEQPNPNVSVTDGPPDNNRVQTQPNATSQTLPPVYFSDINPNDLLPVDTLVTFSVNMTNAVGTDSHAFDPALDTVHINGVPSAFGTWDTSLPQLTNNPVGSRLYSVQILVPKGSPIQQTYKYGINGADNEAGGGSNHVRFIRRTGTYTMALDTFGNQYVEPSFGQLRIGAASGGTVPVSWLGRPGVHLQTKASLAAGPWADLVNTDGSTWANGFASTNGFVSVTNYPTTAASTFLRLIK
jgi:hypothetical protein